MTSLGVTRSRAWFALFAAATVATLALGQAPTPAEASEAVAAGHVVSAERGIVRCANENRRRNGLPPLLVEPSPGRAARLHARNEVRFDFFSHVDHLGRGPGERVRLFDARPWGIGENLVYNASSSSQACRLWMGSAGHRGNVLDPAYTHMGAGFASGRRGLPTHYVQVFGVLYDEEGL